MESQGLVSCGLDWIEWTYGETGLWLCQGIPRSRGSSQGGFESRFFRPPPSQGHAWNTLHSNFSSFPVGHVISHSSLILDMRRDVQEIFRTTPHHKQVMMFSATLAKEIRATCKKFMANVCSAVC